MARVVLLLVERRSTRVPHQLVIETLKTSIYQRQVIVDPLVCMKRPTKSLIIFEKEIDQAHIPNNKWMAV